MKRVGAAVLLPFLLLALEKVNLIKNSSFERDDDTWHAWTKADGWPTVAIANKHDPEKTFAGVCSGSGDTRPDPGNTEYNYMDRADLVQELMGKTIQDIDSLTLCYSLLALNGNILMTCGAHLFLHFDREGGDWLEIGYVLKTPLFDWLNTTKVKYIDQTDFPDDTLWHEFSRDIGGDIRKNYIPPLSQNERVDSLV